MRKRCGKHYVLVMGAAVAVFLAWGTWRGVQPAYIVSSVIDLKRDVSPLGSGLLLWNHFYAGAGGVTGSACGVDDNGRVFLVVERGTQDYVLAFGPDGRFKSETRLQTGHLGVPVGSSEAFAVSNSGKRLWNVQRSACSTGSVGHLVVSCFSPNGSLQQHWVAGRGDVLQFTAVNKDRCYLWTDDEKPYPAFVCKAGELEVSRFLLSGYYPFFDRNGWIWTTETKRSVEEIKPSSTDTPKMLVAFWKQKPGEKRQLYCRALMPARGIAMPFSVDTAGNLYVWLPSASRQPLPHRDHRSIYRVSPGGHAELLFSTADIVSFEKGVSARIGYWFYALPDGSVLFESRTEGHVNPGGVEYTIYKAQLMPRWRIWLRKLGLG